MILYVTFHCFHIELPTVVERSQGDTSSIIGAVFGVFALLLIAFVLVVMLIVVCRRRRRVKGKIHA